MADTAISNLTAASTLTGTEKFPCSDGTATTKQATANQIKTWANNAPVFAAGSASANSTPKLQSGTLMTTPEVGAIEYDGTAPYFTPASSSRSVVLTEQFVALTSTYTLSNTTNAQKLFNVPSNGALTVQASTTYFFECFFTLSSMSGTSGNTSFQLLGGGTATLTSVAYGVTGLDASTLTTGAALGGAFSAASTSTGNITTAATGTSLMATVRGIFRVNAGGTIIPSVALTNAAAAVVGVNSYFRCWPIGSNTVTSVGNWS